VLLQAAIEGLVAGLHGGVDGVAGWCVRDACVHLIRAQNRFRNLTPTASRAQTPSGPQTQALQTGSTPLPSIQPCNTHHRPDQPHQRPRRPGRRHVRPQQQRGGGGGEAREEVDGYEGDVALWWVGEKFEIMKFVECEVC
jgi:hypothetical protein